MTSLRQPAKNTSVTKPSRARPSGDRSQEAGGRRWAARLLPRRQTRSELLEIAAAMARELERRGAQPQPDPRGLASELVEAQACQRAARHLRELLSIAEGRRPAAYWRRPSLSV